MPDPVDEPAAYRALLFDLLGDDDPAAVQASTPAAVRALVGEAGDDVRTRPAEGEWSVLELLGHIADAEIVMSARYRWTLAHDEPRLLNYDQDLWVQRLGHAGAEPADLIAVFEPLRAANLALWARTPASGRSRVGHHEERGPESYETAFRMIAGHDRFHLDQARAALDQVRAKG